MEEFTCEVCGQRLDLARHAAIRLTDDGAGPRAVCDQTRHCVAVVRLYAAAMPLPAGQRPLVRDQGEVYVRGRI